MIDTNKPTIYNLLDLCDMCITLQVAEDNYWQSYVLIQSKYDISTEIKNLEIQAKEYIESFESLVNNFKSEFKNEINQGLLMENLLKLKKKLL